MTYDDNNNNTNMNDNNFDLKLSNEILINSNKRKSNIFITNDNKKFKIDNNNNENENLNILKDNNNETITSTVIPDIISSSIKTINKIDEPFKKDVSTTTSISNEPCVPGTPIILEGIIWQETNRGLLVLNVTWKGKTFVGALFDSNKHSNGWGAPRFLEPKKDDNLQLLNYDPSVRLLRNGKKRFVGKTNQTTTTTTTTRQNSKCSNKTARNLKRTNSTCSSDSSLSTNISNKQNNNKVKIDTNNNNKQIKNKNKYNSSNSTYSSSSMDSVRTNQRQSSLSPALSDTSQYSSSLSNNDLNR